MDKNPVTVETLDNFSNIDKDVSKSPQTMRGNISNLDPEQYADYLEGKINQVDDQDSNNRT